MKRIALTVATVLLASIAFIPTAQATEKELANPNLFILGEFVESAQKTYKYKCTYPAWDPKSKLTELFVRCTNLNSEMYIHANGVPKNGKNDQYVGGTLTYLSVTHKKTGKWEDIILPGPQACAGKVSEGLKDVNAGLTWYKENYKKVTNKKKLTKVIDGHTLSIIGGPGATRTFTCGDKPS